MLSSLLRRDRVQVVRGIAAGLFVLLGVLALGTGLAYAAAATATGTATRAADDSVSGAVTAVDLDSPAGTTYYARYNGIDVGTATSSAGEVTITFDIPAGPDGVPPSDCALLVTVTDDMLDSPLADVPISNCGGQTTPPTTTPPTTPPTTTPPTTPPTTTPPATTPPVTTSPSTPPVTTPPRTTTTGSGSVTATSSPTYVPGPGATGSGSGPDRSWVALGAVLLIGGAALSAGPVLRRR